ARSVLEIGLPRSQQLGRRRRGDRPLLDAENPVQAAVAIPVQERGVGFVPAQPGTQLAALRALGPALFLPAGVWVVHDRVRRAGQRLLPGAGDIGPDPDREPVLQLAVGFAVVRGFAGVDGLVYRAHVRADVRVREVPVELGAGAA